MKTLIQKSVLFILFFTMPSFSQVHPGFQLKTVSFDRITLPVSNWRPLVGGIDFLSDGRIVIAEWGVPASVFLLSGLDGAKVTDVKVNEYAQGLDNVLGLEVVNDTIYVMEREALTQLIDSDGDGKADTYNTINEAFPSSTSMLAFAYDVGYVNGSFMVALSSDVKVGGYNFEPGLPNRATMYKLNRDGTSEMWAGGFSNPNGMGIAGGEVFISDNQGSWTPSSKIIHAEKGNWYGHRTIPATTLEKQTQDPPLLWTNMNDEGNERMGRSIGNIGHLHSGRFKGHMLVGETVNGHPNPVFRVFAERVNGILQGGATQFIKSGTLGGVQRIVQTADSSIYLGLHGSSGSWNQRSDMISGLQQLRENETAVFELMRIRTKGPRTFELEFSESLLASSNQVTRYSVRHWNHNPQRSNGAGDMQNIAALTVNSATVSGNKVTLDIGELKTKYTVKFSFNNLQAQSGRPLFTPFAIYNLTSFGPGTDMDLTQIKNRSHLTMDWTPRASKGELEVDFGLLAPNSMAIYDISGRKLADFKDIKTGFNLYDISKFQIGIYFLKASFPDKIRVKKLAIR